MWTLSGLPDIGYGTLSNKEIKILFVPDEYDLLASPIAACKFV